MREQDAKEYPVLPRVTYVRARSTYQKSGRVSWIPIMTETRPTFSEYPEPWLSGCIRNFKLNTNFFVSFHDHRGESSSDAPLKREEDPAYGICIPADSRRRRILLYRNDIPLCTDDYSRGNTTAHRKRRERDRRCSR